MKHIFPNSREWNAVSVKWERLNDINDVDCETTHSLSGAVDCHGKQLWLRGSVVLWASLMYIRSQSEHHELSWLFWCTVMTAVSLTLVNCSVSWLQSVHGLHVAFTLLSLSVNLLFVGGNSSVTLKWKKDFLPEICTSSVEVYDPELNTWTNGPDLANALCGAGGSELWT